MARREEYGRSWQEQERGRFGTRGGQDYDDEWQARGSGGRQGGRQFSWQDDDDDDRFGSTRHEGREGRGSQSQGSRGSQSQGSQRDWQSQGSQRGSQYEGSRGLSRWEQEDDYSRGRSGTQGRNYEDRSGEMGPTRGRLSHGGGRGMDYAEDWGLHDWPRGRSASRWEDEEEYGQGRYGGTEGRHRGTGEEWSRYGGTSQGERGYGRESERGRYEGSQRERYGRSGTRGGWGGSSWQDDDDDRHGRRGFRGMDPEDWRDR
jgi:hypothetical protein